MHLASIHRLSYHYWSTGSRFFVCELKFDNEYSYKLETRNLLCIIFSSAMPIARQLSVLTSSLKGAVTASKIIWEAFNSTELTPKKAFNVLIITCQLICRLFDLPASTRGSTTYFGILTSLWTDYGHKDSKMRMYKSSPSYDFYSARRPVKFWTRL